MIHVASLAQKQKHVSHRTLHALDNAANIGLASGADQESLNGMNEVVLALAEKVVGHNYSMTASEKQAMDIIENFIQLLFNTSKTQFDEDQGEIDRARDAIQGCTTDANKTMPAVVGLKSTMELAREAHSKCRAAEGQNKDNMTKNCQAYETYRTSDSKRVPPDCMETKFTLAYIGAADKSHDLQQMESCLEETQEWIVPLYQKYIQCKRNTDQNTEHKANCSAKQDKFEQSFCTYASKLEDACNAQTSCRARSVGARNTTHAEVNLAEKARKADILTAHRILCLFKVFEASNTNKTSTLQACLKQSVNTSAYDMTYHSIPDPVACVKEVDEPCQASWKLREYEKQAWFSSIDSLAACKPCPTPQTTTTTTTAAPTTTAAAPKEPTLGQRIPVAKFDKTIGEGYVSIDGSGNIYLGLNGNTHGWVVKFNTADQQVWAQKIKHISLMGIVADDQGNSFVSGQVTPHFALDGQTEFGFGDFGVIKLDTNGQIVWNRQIGSSVNELPFSIALDHNGNILQVGYGTGNFPANKGSYDGNIAKYDSNGQKLWVQNVGTPKADNLFGVAADASGNIFTVGTTAMTPGPGASATLVKLAPDGQQLFFKENTPKDFQQFRDVCIDAVGFAYAAGFTWKNHETLHALVMKFDNDGNQIWTKVLEAVQSTDETRAWKISCAIPGAVMVGGWTKGTMDSKVQYLGGQRDYFVAGLDSTTGNQLWLKQFGTDGNDYFYSLDSKSGRTVMNGRLYPYAYLARLE